VLDSLLESAPHRVALAAARRSGMSRETSGDLTELLARFRRGEPAAEAELITLVYDELHRLASRYMRGERKGHTLGPTALVHEAYLRLVAQQQKSWKNRAHFFAVAALLMRQILVDHARHRLTEKAGQRHPHFSLDDPNFHLPAQFELNPDSCGDVIALDDLLTNISAENPRLGRILEMQIFAGMSHKDIAEVLGIAPRTVDREIKSAAEHLTELMRPVT
jgi:RNA polymerase sigma-70 factor, ECF subfamily